MPLTEPPPPAELVARLRAAGCVAAEDEAAELVRAAGSPDRLTAMVERRCAGEPLEQVVGSVAFLGLRLRVAPGVFVPRRRTEVLAEAAVAAMADRSAPLVVELCCGVAPVAAAVAAARPEAVVAAADLSPAAVACATANLPGGRVLTGDLYDALPGEWRGRVEVLAVNAPYVPTAAIATMPREARDHEPRPALDGGPDGTAVQARVAAQVTDWLAADGVVLVETGRSQSARTAALFRARELVVDVVVDDERDATVVRAVAVAADRP